MTTTQFQGIQALIVDDLVDTRDLLGIILNLHGIATTCVTSVREALEVYQSLKPDIVISGIAMPEEDGLSLIRHIRALKPEEGGQVPAIAITASSVEEIRLAALEAGFQAFLSQPVDIDELIEVVAKVVKSHRQGAKHFHIEGRLEFPFNRLTCCQMKSGQQSSLLLV
ncbi:MAG TPA: response regulator [Allocoleopsis sp.]